MLAVSSIGELDSSRKKVLLLLVAFLIIDCVVAFSAYGNTESGRNARNAITNIEVTTTAGIAAAFATLVVFKQGLSGLHGKTYAALAIGIVLWFVGEAVWTYDEVGLSHSLPSNSLADVLWLAGYGFFGYHLFKTYVYLAKTINKSVVFAVSIAVGLIIWNLISEMIAVADLGSSQGLITFAFRTAFPVGDFVILVPSVLLLITLRKAKLYYSPWFFITISLLVTGLADIAFAYISIANLPDAEWMAAPIYNFAYLSMAGGLYWYNRFVIFDKDRASKLKKRTINE